MKRLALILAALTGLIPGLAFPAHFVPKNSPNPEQTAGLAEFVPENGQNPEQTARPIGAVEGNVQAKAEALDAKGGALENCTWGVLAVNFQGDTLASLYPRKRLVPASNMKLVTTAAAYLKLGRNYTFKTRLETDGTMWYVWTDRD